MKALLFFLAASVALFAAGCANLDSFAPGPADRVLTGVITNNTGGGELPPNTEVTIRVVDLSRGEGRGEVLGEETIMNPARMPVSFRVEYTAEDQLLMRSVNVEARIAVGGRLRYTTVQGHPVTLANVNDSHVVVVEAANR
ncbi:MAG TPA: YbaY family lipoprotein [Opitutus sp.]|nr:YbaY family lipoprotein [Opitutus sp.]